MRMVTVMEAVDRLGVSETWLRRRVKLGKFRHLKVGHLTLVDLDEIVLDPLSRPGWIGIAEASELTGLPRYTLRSAVQKGELPGIKEDRGQYRFPAAELLEALRKRREGR